MNRFYIIAIIALSSQSFAATANNTSKPKPKSETFFNQGDEGLKKNQFQEGYNEPARIEIQDSWDVAFDGSFIYWHASQENMDIAKSISLVPPTTALVAQQKFKYKPGFKVGMSFNTGHDDWTFGAEYIWLHETIKDSFTAPSTSHPWDIGRWVIGIGHSSTNTVTSEWKLQFNLIDGYATRPYYQGKYLTISPRGGIRGLWINQKLDIESGNTFSHLQSKNWMIGPSVGMDMHWLIGCGFRFESIANASILFTRFTKISVHDSLTLGNTEQASQNNRNTATPIIDMGLGLGWGTYFADNGAHFDLAARYDFMYLWGQNAMLQFVESTFDASAPIGALALQGLTLTARFDF